MQRKDAWSRLAFGRGVRAAWIFGFTFGCAAGSSGSSHPVSGAPDAGGPPDATTDIPVDAPVDAPSDGGSTEDGARIPEAGPDDALDALPMGDGPGAEGGQACTPQPIWPPDADGFTYSQSGGFVVQPPPDAGCPVAFVDYQFSSLAMTLSKHACDVSGRSDLTVNLTQAQTLQIVTNLKGLATSCPSNNCGADYPHVALAVLVPPAQSITYTSDFYAGCSGALVSPPFISYQGLGVLVSLLDSIVTLDCPPSDGGVNPASCVTAPADGGGPPDGGTDARACSGSPPNCFGSDLGACCGNDPSAPALCHDGAWMCGSAPAPGCNGRSCLLPPLDASADARPLDAGSH